MKFITECIDCKDDEEKNKKGNRFSWITKNTNQAQIIKSIHLSTYELHNVEVRGEE